MFDTTQPNRRMDSVQAVRSQPRQKRRGRWIWFWMFLLLFIYFFAPLRTNFLLLGTDDSPERGSLGRTDTIILFSVVPLRPYVAMLSIPRDLWVTVPAVGEQRINTAYFFAEANQPSSGAQAVMETIDKNFRVPIRYYAVVHMIGLISVIDTLGGVGVKLGSAMGGLPVGTTHLNGTQALEFVRERSSSDDFGRMQRTQVLLSAVLMEAFQPSAWRNLPQFITAVVQTVDTNLPFWQWPRLFFALLRTVFFGMDSRTISREMVTPFQTSGGAQVLAPNWDTINPVLLEMFGRWR